MGVASPHPHRGRAGGEAATLVREMGGNTAQVAAPGRGCGWGRQGGQVADGILLVPKFEAR